MNENIIVPPLHPLLADRNRAGGVQTQITEKKNSDKGVYCWFFLQLYYIFFTVQKGRNIYRGGGGGGGCNFLLFFFFLGGGGWGGYKSLFL